jgi:hypothetical protein
MGRRYYLFFLLAVNLHMRFSGSLEGYLFLKRDISSNLDLSLTRDVDLICLQRFIVPHKCTFSS